MTIRERYVWDNVDFSYQLYQWCSTPESFFSQRDNLNITFCKLRHYLIITWYIVILKANQRAKRFFKPGVFPLTKIGNCRSTKDPNRVLLILILMWSFVEFWLYVILHVENFVRILFDTGNIFQRFIEH
jgi:hypothetical protein